MRELEVVPDNSIRCAISYSSLKARSGRYLLNALLPSPKFWGYPNSHPSGNDFGKTLVAHHLVEETATLILTYQRSSEAPWPAEEPAPSGTVNQGVLSSTILLIKSSSSLRSVACGVGGLSLLSEASLLRSPL